jgi:hypothetical protein
MLHIKLLRSHADENHSTVTTDRVYYQHMSHQIFLLQWRIEAQHSTWFFPCKVATNTYGQAGYLLDNTGSRIKPHQQLHKTRNYIFLINHPTMMGNVVVQLGIALCYKLEGCMFNS